MMPKISWQIRYLTFTLNQEIAYGVEIQSVVFHELAILHTGRFWIRCMHNHEYVEISVVTGR